jgi:hypothetical protein
MIHSALVHTGSAGAASTLDTNQAAAGTPTRQRTAMKQLHAEGTWAAGGPSRPL